jgi:hypothetical protein
MECNVSLFVLNHLFKLLQTSFIKIVKQWIFLVWIQCVTLIPSLNMVAGEGTWLHAHTVSTGSIKSIYSAVHLTSFHRGVSHYWPPVSKQTVHLLKIFVNTWWSTNLEILVIVVWILSFSSCNNLHYLHKLCLALPLTSYNPICRWRRL